MTDNEAICTAIVGGFTVLGAAIRLSVGVLKGVADRVVKAIDESTAAWKETSATVGRLTERLASMEGQLKMKEAVETSVEAAVQEVKDEVSGVHEAQPLAPIAPTPPGGYLMVRNKRPRGA